MCPSDSCSLFQSFAVIVAPFLHRPGRRILSIGIFTSTLDSSPIPNPYVLYGQPSQIVVTELLMFLTRYGFSNV